MKKEERRVDAGHFYWRIFSQILQFMQLMANSARRRSHFHNIPLNSASLLCSVGLMDRLDIKFCTQRTVSHDLSDCIAICPSTALSDSDLEYQRKFT